MAGRPKELIGQSTRILYRSDDEYEEIAKLLYSTLERRRTFPGVSLPPERRHRDPVHDQRGTHRGEAEQRGIVITYENITYRKQFEKELELSRGRLRDLSLHLQTVREKERTRIARELHDELGQLLTALNTGVILLKRRSRRSRASPRADGSMKELIDMTMQTVKRIYMDLRPGMLDHLGLPTAMEWQCQEFEKRTGIQCTVDVEPEDMEPDKDALHHHIPDPAGDPDECREALEGEAGEGEPEEEEDELELVVIGQRQGNPGSGAPQAEIIRPSGDTGARRIPGRRGENHRQKGKGDDRDGSAAHPERRHGMIKILIADDHPIVRQGFKQVLSDTADLVVADEAGNGQEVLSLVAKKDYDVILLDISMPGKNGLEVLKELKLMNPKIPV